jgi:tRNA (cytidine/uridine-2'-O-)-methyltransferase
MAFTVDDSKLKRAGLDYWHLLDITYYDNLTDFFERNQGPFLFFTTKGDRVHSGVDYPEGCYLVFGREDAGLPEWLLRSNPDSLARIPMIEDARSLNLSNAVAIAVYEALRRQDYPGFLRRGFLPPAEGGCSRAPGDPDYINEVSQEARIDGVGQNND